MRPGARAKWATRPSRMRRFSTTVPITGVRIFPRADNWGQVAQWLAKMEQNEQHWNQAIERTAGRLLASCDVFPEERFQVVTTSKCGLAALFLHCLKAGGGGQRRRRGPGMHR